MKGRGRKEGHGEIPAAAGWCAKDQLVLTVAEPKEKRHGPDEGAETDSGLFATRMDATSPGPSRGLWPGPRGRRRAPAEGRLGPLAHFASSASHPSPPGWGAPRSRGRFADRWDKNAQTVQDPPSPKRCISTCDRGGSRPRSTQSLQRSTARWAAVGVQRAYGPLRVLVGCRYRCAFPLV